MAKNAREVTVQALQKRNQALEAEHQKNQNIEKVIFCNAYKNWALSPLMRAYVDSLQ